MHSLKRGLGRAVSSPFFRAGVGMLPGGGSVSTAMDLLSGDPKAKKRAVRKLAKKGHAVKAKKGPGGKHHVGGTGKSDARAKAMMDTLLSAGPLAALGKEGKMLMGGRVPGFGGKRRTMRVTNPKALRRSMRRVEGFAKLAKRTMSFVHQHKLKTHRKGRR